MDECERITFDDNEIQIQKTLPEPGFSKLDVFVLMVLLAFIMTMCSIMAFVHPW